MYCLFLGGLVGLVVWICLVLWVVVCDLLPFCVFDTCT